MTEYIEVCENKGCEDTILCLFCGRCEKHCFCCRFFEEVEE